MRKSHEPAWLMAVAQSHGNRRLAKPRQAEGRRYEIDDRRSLPSSPSSLRGKVIVYNGARCIYICVNGTLCEPLFVQFPGDSWIRYFENPK